MISTTTTTTCVRCNDTSRPMELTDAGWVCLLCTGRRPHLVLVSDKPTELESLLLASLTAKGVEARAMTEGLAATLDAVEHSLLGVDA